MFHFTRFLPQWRRLLLSLLLVLPGLALAAIDGACQPNHWPDGDTFHYKNSKGQVVKVRVAGFDAPERGQPFSKVARERLVALTEGGARCHCERKDKYGRQVCTVRTPPGENVAVIMLREGLGCIDPRFEGQAHPQDRLAAREALAQAKSQQLGMWSEAKPVCAFDYRKQQK